MVGLGAAGLVAGLYGEWAFSRTGASPVAVLSDLAAGWAFVAAGLVAWWRQPGNRVGPLVLAEGFAWFVTDLQGAGVPPVSAAGVLLGGVNEAILVHLMLALPSGRLEARLERMAVTAAYALALGLGLLYAVAGGPPYDPYACSGCDPGVGLPAVAGPPLRTAQRTGEVLAVLLAVAVAGLVVRRLVRSTGPRRRTLAPVWLALGVSSLLLLEHLADAFPGRGSAPAVGLFVLVANAGQLAVPLGFLVVALRMRLVRAAVGELVLELGSSLSPEALREALLQALGDPSLEVAFWHEGSGAYRDRSGRPVTTPEADGSRGVTRIEHGGAPVALVLHDPALADDARLMETVAAAARLIADRERLRRELRTRLDTADAERRRMERDLHDGAQQRFVSLSLTLSSALEQARRGREPGAVEATLTRAADELRLGLAELRELARGIHPAVLTERGLAAAAESVASRMPVPVAVRVEPGRWDPVVEATAYFLVSEALTNVARHARATRASVLAERQDGWLLVEVADDGSGGADPRRGSGLRGLEDRVAAAGGELRVESPPGGGTRVRARLPCG